MKDINYRNVMIFALVVTFYVTTAAKPLPAQNVRVGNVVVHGQPAGQSNNALPPRPAINTLPSTSPVSTTQEAPTPDADQLRRLSELTPPPKADMHTVAPRQPLPVVAEPEPLVTQQTSRTGTPSSQAADGTQSTGNRTASTEPAKPAPPASAAVKKPTDNDTETDIERALELYRQNDFEQAKALLKKICRADPKLPPPGIFLVQFAIAAGQSDRIRFWLDQATWDHPDDPEAYTLLAEFAINDGRLAEAKLLVEKGVSLLENIASNEDRRQSIENSADSVQGRLYQIRGDWDQARSFFESLAARDKDNADIFARLGFVAANQQLYDKAVANFQQAIDKGAKLPVPKLIVSQIADQQGKTDVADKFFNEVMKATDIDAESIRIAVQIQLDRGNIAEAEKFHQQAIKSEPDNIDNVLQAGMIDLYKKDYPAAEKRFQDAILINPDSYAAAQGLAQALVEQDDSLKKERALAYAKSNVQKYGETTDAVATLAWVCFKSDKMVEAEYLVNLALGGGELSPLSAYYFAEITAAVGQTDKAGLLAKIAAGSKSHFMKKAEAEALLKKLESGQIKSAPTPSPNKDAAAKTNAGTETKTPPPIRIPGTRN